MYDAYTADEALRSTATIDQHSNKNMQRFVSLYKRPTPG